MVIFFDSAMVFFQDVWCSGNGILFQVHQEERKFSGYMHSGTHKTDSFMFLKKIPPIKNFKATVLHLFHFMPR